MKIEFIVTLAPIAMERLKLTSNLLMVGNNQEVGGSDELWDYLNEQGIQPEDVLVIAPSHQSSHDRIIDDAIRTLDSKGVVDIILDVDQETNTFLIASVMHGSLVEYQISDGPPGFRSNSQDTYFYTEAENMFDTEVKRYSI